MAKSLEERGRLTVTYVNPTPSGHINPADVNAAIRDTTCLVCVMHANNETGAIMDIKSIGAISHKRNVPFHCDTVQTFGKYPLNPILSNVDSFCVSFHKFGGPPGIGCTIVKQQMLIGYGLQPLIFGSQNEHLRGGTENLPGIGAAFCALKCAMDQREAKNLSALAIKRYIMKEIAKFYPVRFYPDYLKAAKANLPGGTGAPMPQSEIVFLSGIKNGSTNDCSDQDYLHNTILLSVIKRPGGKGGKASAPMCNTEMKMQLEKRGIVLSVGSACNTASPKASHVLYAMDADEYVRKGALRISLGDLNTLDEAKKFIGEFMKVVSAQLEK
jgi:cysteine desulfurase